jgi:serine phosphatase RsbU (regulator of sigma subunit)
MSHPKPIRRTLVTYLSAAVLLLGGTIWGVVYLGELELVEQWCGESIQLQLRMADLRLRAFFDPVTHSVELLGAMGNQSTLNVDDTASLQPLFVTLLDENPQASAVMLADERGHEFFLMRRGDQWTSRQTRRDEWNDSQTFASWQTGAESETWQENSDYDPRQRPWFRQALRDVPNVVHVEPLDHSTANVHWTRPYRFFSEKTPGITASAWFYDAEGRKCVVALDVLLSDLQEFTKSMQVGRHGTLAFVDNFGWPIESPEEIDTTASERESTPPTERDFSRPETFAAVQALSAVSLPETSAISFTHAGRTWWADSQPFRLSTARKWEAVVVVPESDFTGGLSTIRFWVAVISATVLAIAGIWAVRFADRIGRPLEALVHASEQISLGHLDQPAHIKSNLKEVSDLAAAQEEMRTALRSLVKHERDLQVAREIQQSTFPNSFPILDNFQFAGWSEPAEQTGGDTFDVIAVKSDDSNETAIYLMLADASGHGIGPALTAVRIHSLFHVAIEKCENVGEIAGLINRQLCHALPTGRFATAWLARLDPVGRRLDSFSAGQGPILWYRSETNDVEIVMTADSMPCGILEDVDMSGGGTCCFEQGDLVAVISDGIFEATNSHDEQFGAERVATILQSLHESSANEILTAIRDAIDVYTDRAAASDDRTIIIVKCVKD